MRFGDAQDCGVNMLVFSQVGAAAGVETDLVAVARRPHKSENQGVDYHNDGAQGIAEHVQEHSAHVQLGGRLGTVIQVLQ